MTKPIAPGDPEKTVDAQRVRAQAGFGPGGSEFTYSVLPEPATDAASRRDRRRAPRQRTRLRSGKIVGATGVFLIECLIYDMSARGCRIRLAAGMVLPRSIQLFDDQSGHLHRGSVLWRDGNDAGIRFEAQANPDRARDQAEALRRKFYAVRN